MANIVLLQDRFQDSFQDRSDLTSVYAEPAKLSGGGNKMSATMIADPVVTVIVGTTGIVTLASLLLEVAAGDRDAFEEVYRRSSAKLFGVCRLILPDRN